MYEFHFFGIGVLPLAMATSKDVHEPLLPRSLSFIESYLSELNGFTMMDSKVVTRLFTSYSSLLILALPPSLCLVLSLSLRIPHISFVAVVTAALSCAVRNHLSSAPSFLDMPIIPPFVFESRLTLFKSHIRPDLAKRLR